MAQPCFGSATAAELGFVATLGAGIVPTRVISCDHCVAVRELVVTTGTGAVLPLPAECAAEPVAAAASALLLAAGANSRCTWFQLAASERVLGWPG